MSKVKKILAMIVSLAMVLGMSMTTFAAEGDPAEKTNVEVSVNNAKGAAITYLQIVEADRTTAEGWKFVDGYASYFAAQKMTIEDVIALAEVSPNANAKAGDNINHEALATVLQAIIESGDVTGSTANEKFAATKGGLYLIQAVKEGVTYSPMMAYVAVDSTTPVAVTAKGAPNQIHKSVDETTGKSIAPGERVPYDVNVAYPYFAANYTNPTFKVTDTLINATFDQTTLKLTFGVDESPLVADQDYTVSYNTANDTVTINFVYDMAKAGKGDVNISYTAIASDTISSADTLKNTVDSELKAENDATPTRTEAIVESNLVKATFTKVDAEDSTKMLEGAEFQLYEGEPDTGVAVGAPVKSDTNGVVTFEGLDAERKYYVVETKAPEGYTVDATPHVLVRSTAKDTIVREAPSKETVDGVEVTILTTTYTYDGDFGITETPDEGNIVKNTKLSSLPSTGGIGTTIFTIGGCIIMIAAAALFFASRRKNGK